MPKSSPFTFHDMKKLLAFFGGFYFAAAPLTSNAQFDVGSDIVNAYVWRGSILADGPAVQPWVTFSTGEAVSLEIGAWGSYTFFAAGDGQGVRPSTEADLYVTLGLGPVSLTVTDYYFPSSAISYFDHETGHTFEAAVGAEFGALELLAAYNFAGFRDLDADGENDPGIYFEAALGFESGVNLFAGVGDEFYGAESFGLVNVGLGYEKQIVGSIPAFGQVILNPEAESFAIVFGVSL